MVPADSHRVSRAPRYSGYRCPAGSFVYGAVILCGATFQTLPLASMHGQDPVLLPRGCALGTCPGLGCSPVARHYWGNHCFARHYWGNHCCFLFLEVLRCFSSLRSPPHPCGADDRPSDGRVVPFGYPRVKGHLHLTADFRSLSRPSSPP